jgi:type II secretory pathway predicted ATPase ExeA
LDDRQPKRSLADDPKFLASLSELDQGLSDANSELESGVTNVEPFAQAQAPLPPPRPVAPRPPARVPPAPITPAPVARPITIATPPPPLAAHPAPPPSAIGLPEPPPWLPPSAFSAINAAAVALSQAFDSPSTAPAAPAAAPTHAPAAPGPRTLLDLFPPAVSFESTAPSLPVREHAAPPPIAAIEPPRVAVRPRHFPAAAPPRGVTYETFYGLDEKPFAAPPDLRFLYHSSAHDRALQDLVSSVNRRDPIAVCTGERGIGKTLLCRALVDQLDRRTLVSFVTDAPSSAEDLLRTLLVDFGVVSPDDATTGGLAAASRDDLAGALRDFLGSLVVLQASGLLIIDGAHSLQGPVLQELRALAELAAGGTLLQIVFVGEPALTRLLKTNDLRAVNEHVKVRVEIGPLDEDEIPGYVAHRIAVAGRGGRVEFGESALRKMFAVSRGVPGLVNQICDRALTRGYQSSASHIDADIVEQAAQDAGLSPAEGGDSVRDRALIAVLMVSLMLVGAAAAGWVFREPLSRAWAQWRGGGPPTSSTAR